MSEVEQAGSLDRDWEARSRMEMALAETSERLASSGHWSARWNDGIMVECSVTDPSFSVWWKRRFSRWDDSHELPLSLILDRTSSSINTLALASKLVSWQVFSANTQRVKSLDSIARDYLNQIERWLNEHLARCYRIGDLSPEPDRTIAAAVSRRSAERRHRVPGRLPGEVTSHYPLLRDPEIFARFERELAAELLSG